MVLKKNKLKAVDDATSQSVSTHSHSAALSTRSALATPNKTKQNKTKQIRGILPMQNLLVPLPCSHENDRSPCSLLIILYNLQCYLPNNHIICGPVIVKFGQIQRMGWYCSFAEELGCDFDTFYHL